MQFLRSKRPNLKPVVQLAFETGLRFEDILRICNRTIRKHEADHFVVRFKRSKKYNAKDDLIFIRKELMEEIRHFYGRSGYYLFEELAREPRGTAYQKLRYWIRQAVGAVLNLNEDQMKGIGFHITRRTFMTIGVMSGSFSFEEGSRNLGHSSLKVTEERYLFLRRNPQNSIMNYFNFKEVEAITKSADAYLNQPIKLIDEIKEEE